MPAGAVSAAVAYGLMAETWANNSGLSMTTKLQGRASPDDGAAEAISITSCNNSRCTPVLLNRRTLRLVVMAVITFITSPK
jgi:hypothetical protein